MIRSSLARTLALVLPAVGIFFAASSAEAAPRMRPRMPALNMADRLNGHVVGAAEGTKVSVKLSDVSFKNFGVKNPQKIVLRAEIKVAGRNFYSKNVEQTTNDRSWTVWADGFGFDVDIARAGRFAKNARSATACVVAKSAATRMVVGRECTTVRLAALPAKPPAMTSDAVKETLDAKNVTPADVKTVEAIEQKSGNVEDALQKAVEVAVSEERPQIEADAKKELAPKVEEATKTEANNAAQEASAEIAAVGENAQAEVNTTEAVAPPKRGIFKKMKPLFNKAKQAVAKVAQKHLGNIAGKVTSKLQGFVSKLGSKVTSKILPGLQAKVEKFLKLKPGQLNFAREKLASLTNKAVTKINSGVANFVTKKAMPFAQAQIAKMGKLPPVAQEAMAEVSADVQAEASVPAGGEGSETEGEDDGEG